MGLQGWERPAQQASDGRDSAEHRSAHSAAGLQLRVTGYHFSDEGSEVFGFFPFLFGDTRSGVLEPQTPMWLLLRPKPALTEGGRGESPGLRPHHSKSLPPWGRVGGLTQQCPGLPLGSVLKHHPGGARETEHGVRRAPGSARCKAKAFSSALNYLSPAPHSALTVPPCHTTELREVLSS